MLAVATRSVSEVGKEGSGSYCREQIRTGGCTSVADRRPQSRFTSSTTGESASQTPRATLPLDHVTIGRLNLGSQAQRYPCSVLRTPIHAPSFSYTLLPHEIPLCSPRTPSGPFGRLRKASPHSEPRCPLVARHLPSLKGQEPLDSSTSTTDDPHLPITKPAAPPPWTQTWRT